MFAVRNAVSLSSFGGEGQGEEAVTLSYTQHPSEMIWRTTPLEERSGQVTAKVRKGLLSPARAAIKSVRAMPNPRPEDRGPN